MAAARALPANRRDRVRMAAYDGAPRGDQARPPRVGARDRAAQRRPLRLGRRGTLDIGARIRQHADDRQTPVRADPLRMPARRTSEVESRPRCLRIGSADQARIPRQGSATRGASPSATASEGHDLRSRDAGPGARRRGRSGPDARPQKRVDRLVEGSVSRLKLGFERRPARKAVVAGDRQLRTRKGDLVGHAP